MRIYDGNDTSGQLLAEVSGTGNVSSCSNQVHVVFSSGQYPRDGYYAKIHSSKAKCFSNQGMQGLKQQSSFEQDAMDSDSMIPMYCPEYASIGNGICNEVNNNLVCLFDGGDCSEEEITPNCTNLECSGIKTFDPCPISCHF